MPYPLGHGACGITIGQTAIILCFRNLKPVQRGLPLQQLVQILNSVHIRCSIVVSISACHADDPGSITGGGVCPVCDRTTDIKERESNPRRETPSAWQAVALTASPHPTPKTRKTRKTKKPRKTKKTKKADKPGRSGNRTHAGRPHRLSRP